VYKFPFVLSRYIRELIEQGEHQQLDFKFEINDARKIARTLSAFANTEGGKLLIGVKDNGKIAGVRSEEEYHMIEAAAGMYCKPPVDFEVQKWTILGKTILEVDIARAENKPCLALSEEDRWLAYIRAGDQNLLANKVMLKVWQKEKRKKGILVEYSKTEEMLLDYLESNKQITLSKFCRICKIQRRQAERILSDLIALDVIRIRISEKGATYSLVKQE
jgi:predicted HTH transcriptional regulator